MISSPSTEYRPESVSPPGDSLLDTLEALGMSQAELAERSGLAGKTISQIVNGKAPITETTALALERVLGTPARFWLARESKYREFLARRQDEDLHSAHTSWARSFPYKNMADLGWLPGTQKAAEKAAHLLRFFAVQNESCWRAVWSEPELAFRKTARCGRKLEVVSAWLRQGEIKARTTDLPAFDEPGFKQTIQDLRTLTTDLDSDFVDEVRRRCAGVGVRYQLIPELPSLGIYGVTRWLGDHPLIQQSLLLKSHDHFWFTFFHETRHVLQKRKKRIFLEGDNLDQQDTEREADANRFAGDLLIPPAAWRRFLAAGTPNSTAIRTFSHEIDIHPGIVVGRLMREKHLDYSHPAGRLRIKMTWKP